MGMGLLHSICVFILSILDCIISIKFLLGIQEKAFKKKYWITFTVFFSLIYSIICSSIPEYTYYMLVSFSFHILFSIILFNGHILLKMFYGVIIVVLGGITESISGVTIAIFAKISFAKVLEIPAIYITAAVSSKIILIFMLQVIIRFKKSKYEKIPFKYWIVLTFVPILSLISAYINTLNDYNFSYDKLIPIYFTLLILILINVIIFIIFDEIVRNVELEKIKKASEQQLREEQEYYKQMIENNKATRSIWHDMNNHFIVLQNLLDLNQLEKMKLYLGDLATIVKANGMVSNSGNLIVDCIVSEKKSFCAQNYCNLTCELSIPSNLTIEPIDLCIILGNTLDNAIEECQRIKDGYLKKEIILKVIHKDNQLFISVSNPTNGSVSKKGERIITKKPDFENHGYGLKNIEAIALKYDGIIDILTDNDIFKLNISLKLE